MSTTFQHGDVQKTQSGRDLKSTEAALAELWALVLEVDSVDVGEDFFALGGDSLQVVSLFGEVAHIFSVELSLETILNEASTVARMAEVIEREQNKTASFKASPPKVSTLVPFSEIPTGSPIFAVPGHAGFAIGYAHLARELAPEYKVHGFQFRGLDGSQAPDRHIEEIARFFIGELLGILPDGPYRLFGTCFGAIVAYEMAQQLRSSGKEVALLAMLDPPGGILSGRSAKWRPSRFPILKFVIDRLGLYRREFKMLGGSERIAFIKRKFSTVWRNIARRDLFRGNHPELHHKAVVESNIAAIQSYLPVPYKGPAIILLTEAREIVGTQDLRLKWLDMISDAGGSRQIPAKDNVFALKPPDVSALAKILTAEISNSPVTD